MTGTVRKLQTTQVEKVWGRTSLPAPFAVSDGKRIGEIWFDPPAELQQLLVKYLFTCKKLSVQVHPSSANALPGEDGKAECWLVLDAEPGAKLGIGFRENLSRDALAKAALDGSIEELMSWHEPKAGDVFFLPPGTVHAIGPGLALVEIQQNSDTTFRLYDYGRPRELHVERALEVASRGPYPSEHVSSLDERGTTLLESEHFRIDRIEGQPGRGLAQRYDSALLALPLAGSVKEARGDAVAKAGECLYADSLDALDFSKASVTLLTCPA